MSSFFSSQILLDLSKGSSTRKKGEFIGSRRKRRHIKGFSLFSANGFSFGGGDILRVGFLRGGQSYYFEGICLAVKKKRFQNKESSFILRNVIQGVGIEVIISYYFNRVYSLSFSDYKRKRFSYSRPKLYYLRARTFRESTL